MLCPRKVYYLYSSLWQRSLAYSLQWEELLRWVNERIYVIKNFQHYIFDIPMYIIWIIAHCGILQTHTLSRWTSPTPWPHVLTWGYGYIYMYVAAATNCKMQTEWFPKYLNIYRLIILCTML